MINMLNIRLEFKNHLTGIAGFLYGQQTYKDQVQSKLKGQLQAMTIVFPDNIERVASSFVQGFFSDIINKVGYDDFDDIVTIKAKTEDLAEEIRGNIR